MNGFEYQVAAHMIYEGQPGDDLVRKGLAIARAVHDRYDAAKRNPFNEIECSDHYARSMASYGVFLALSGFVCHGPEGDIGFSPRIDPENFQTPFVTAEGWGTYSQRIVEGEVVATLLVRWGRLRLRSIRLGLPFERRPTAAALTHHGNPVPASIERTGATMRLLFDRLTVEEGEELVLRLDTGL